MGRARVGAAGSPWVLEIVAAPSLLTVSRASSQGLASWRMLVSETETWGSVGKKKIRQREKEREREIFVSKTLIIFSAN